MRHRAQVALVGIGVCLVATHPPQAAAATYTYPASCTGSYSKQGNENADLTKLGGMQINCDAIVLSLPENGHVLIQVAEKTSHLTPLGFAGNGLDYEVNPNLVTIPLSRIYLPHSSDPSQPESIGGIQGFCFLDGKMNIRYITEIACTAKVELGTEKLIYNIKAKIHGVGQRVPGM
jgi:hypothetical protein